jgi:heterodisulfide reductase subunit B
MKIATHPGCHFLKPPEILQTDNPENPQKLDRLVEALGAQAIPYLNKLECCGAGTRSTDQKLAVSMAHEKIVGAQQANADALVTICPTCFVQFDIGQRLMARQFEEKTNLPVFYFAELLALAMGIDLDIGFKMHTIKLKSILEPFSA